ncbi:imidazole glycerol phosphate synthase subunit HisH [Paenibacillus hemerocallicola]|uniref:Imidazole glycerol phosphate synthase subunit HisH n=1 Tax=Paenibacillus hemerocallicola TaxID=1172614 RepID=A0A5C4T5P8_9BACL|nr:imidazole glycerol phosphate synthase subunit HisH [Paenibacillus hemerocallicola]TNJ64368.1 imidazole glycerol phosphate synthase subunit HisH [Paenibacillus hemerocallicola]
MIGIIDYGAGNLFSVQKSIEKLGKQAKIVSYPEDFTQIDKVILPGVGNAKRTMDILDHRGLSRAINEIVKEIPFLGICLGMQLLLDYSKENDATCLGIVSGGVVPFDQSLRVPHMGWNEVKQEKKHRIFDGIPDKSNFYFVHSYRVFTNDSEHTIGTTIYDGSFSSVIAKEDHIIGVQFHPEKSGETGLLLLENFCRL